MLFQKMRGQRGDVFPALPKRKYLNWEHTEAVEQILAKSLGFDLLVQISIRRGNNSQRVAIVVGDITQPETAERIVNAAIDRFGGVNVLINNAGIFERKPFTGYTVEELDGYLGYLRGTFVMTHAAVRQMRAQGVGGAVINIGTIFSMNGVAGVPSIAPIAAKGGITALTRNLSTELAADRIRINAVAPGIVPTPLYEELSDEDRRGLHAMQPLGHYGKPSDIADAVLYLANASWVTGVILPVDGGVRAGGDGNSRVANKPK